jgi:hypothetical protein
MRGRLTIMIAALALGLTPATALATSQDVASTHAYILANFALARATEARVGTVQTDVVRLNRKLGQECRDAAAGSPQNEESQKVSHEVAGALWSVAYGADAGPIGAFVRAVKPLRWSNHKLTRMAQSYATNLRKLAALSLPNICADVRAWRASGFRTVPATTLSFNQYAESIETHTIPARLLVPFERPSDRGVVARTTHLEYELEGSEISTGFNDWELLLDTLGLNE